MTVLSSKKILQEKNTNDANSITSLTLTHKALTDVILVFIFSIEITLFYVNFLAVGLLGFMFGRIQEFGKIGSWVQ